MNQQSHAVFLSYASQDAQVAARICEALRAGGVEVFLDQSELRGGDAWDQKIRHEIHACALFIPIISEHTQERLEGYFRHEWNLAVERIHHMAQQKSFLVPVVVDGTRDQDAFVPDVFRAVQWTHLPGGETHAAFVERVKRLLSLELSPRSTVSDRVMREPARASSWSQRAAVVAFAVMVLAAGGYFGIRKLWLSTPAAAAFAPPPHSIAVLPFANMSGDKNQDYFSDGLTEELLNSLAATGELQVAARTSAFFFKGKDTDIQTIARKLNVGAVLEGSVRRSSNTVRVTTQLINAVTGFHLWSHTYDRDMGDVLKLQTEIAGAVASVLKVNLLGDVAAKIEAGGTRNPAAFDAYLRARKVLRSASGDQDTQMAIAGFSEAIRLDPSFALAFAWRSLAYSDLSYQAINYREIPDHMESDARAAIRLAPDLAEGYGALGRSFDARPVFNFTEAREAFEQALALGPGNSAVLAMSSDFLAQIGRIEEAISTARRAVALDPLNGTTYYHLGLALLSARRYQEAIAPFDEAIRLDPQWKALYADRGRNYYMLHDLESARSSCEHDLDYFGDWHCLAMVYFKLGRHAEAEQMLAKWMAQVGDEGYPCGVYAQWGKRDEALDCLEEVLRRRPGHLLDLRTDPFMDPLRNEPRFQAVVRELNFPE